MMLERRSFLLAATGAFVYSGTALAAAAKEAAGAATDPPGFARLDLNDPGDALTGMLRMQGRLDNKDSPWWYFGRIYGLLPGQAPVPLVRYEGLEIMRLTKTPEGEYAATGVTTSFFMDWRTKAVLDVFANPVSGRTNQVKPNLIGGKPGAAAAFYSAKGVRPGRLAAADWRPDGLHLSWDSYGDDIWLSNDRTYPPGLPQPMGESSVSRARRADLHDLERPFVPASFSSTYFAPWPAWMDMQGQPGHVVWHADGLKLESVDRLPAHFRRWMDQRHPERLAAPPYFTT
jgi:hypothetical protein